MRTLLQKIGIGPGSRVAVINFEDPELIAQITELAADFVEHAAPPDSDLILWQITHRDELEELDSLMKSLRPEGVLWVVRPRTGGRVSEEMIRQAALAIGMVDVKVLRFSEQLTGVKLVIRRENRPAASTRPRRRAAEPPPPAG